MHMCVAKKTHILKLFVNIIKIFGTIFTDKKHYTTRSNKRNHYAYCCTYSKAVDIKSVFTTYSLVIQ